MEKVGIRELRNSLSRYVERVKRGELLVVTERGKPVARIIPAGVPERLARLMAEGRVTWSGQTPKAPKLLPPLKPGPPLSQYISEDRR